MGHLSLISTPHNKMREQLQLISIISYEAIFLWSIPPSTISIKPQHTPQKLPYTSISVVSSLVCTHFDLHSLRFSLRLDKTASVWRLQKLVSNKLIDLLCFSIQEKLKHRVTLLFISQLFFVDGKPWSINSAQVLNYSSSRVTSLILSAVTQSSMSLDDFIV